MFPFSMISFRLVSTCPKISFLMSLYFGHFPTKCSGVSSSFDEHFVHFASFALFEIKRCRCSTLWPVIILKHQVNGTEFHTLYGHLSTESLNGLEVGQKIEQGQAFASFGKYEENFHWPPHLHFQVIVDMQGIEGDYPGVCRKSESVFYFDNCPDPRPFL